MKSGDTIEPGRRFHRWIVVREAERGHDGRQLRRRWRVRCRCAREKTVKQRDLVGGRSTGCPSEQCRRDWAIDQLREVVMASLIQAGAPTNTIDAAAAAFDDAQDRL